MFFIIGILSIINGLLYKGDYYIIEDLKRVLQLITILLYSIIFINKDKLIVNIFRIFYLWVFTLVLFFYAYPDLYKLISNFLYPEMLDTFEGNVLDYRFNYFYSDPNTCGYFICLTLFLYYSIEKNNTIFFFCSVLASIVILTTQSRGAYIGLSFIFIFIFIKSQISLLKKIIITSVIIAFIFAITGIFENFYNSIYRIFEIRMEAEKTLGQGLGGGRIGKYEYFINNINLWPIGVGYSLLRDGVDFRPHSDLIRLNLSYGIFSIPLFLYFVFPREKSQITLFIIFLIPFLINSIVDDYKLFPFYLIAYNILGQTSNSSINTKAYKLKVKALRS